MPSDPRGAPFQLGGYELLGRLAKGGMAEIYLARPAGDSALIDLVVLKRILPHLAEEPQFVAMFLEEARLAALIDHPNVVRIREVARDADESFIVMEYIDGPSVGDLCRVARRTGEPLPVEVAAEIVYQSCDGLHAAHELEGEDGHSLGLVHRDVSPHNLMLATSGLVKLVDFGIAKAQDTAVKTNTGSIKGKFPYMSPEQCQGKPLDRRTDVFSLAIVFYELLTARRLFQRPSELMILKAITEDEIPSPRDFNDKIPEPVQAVLLKALARHREDRYETSEAFADALRSAVEASGLEWGPATIQQYLLRNCSEMINERALQVKEILESDKTQVATDQALRPRRGSSSMPSSATPSSRSQSESAKSARTGPPQRKPTLHSEGPGFFRRNRGILISITLILAALGGGFAYRFSAAEKRPTGTPLRYGITRPYTEAAARDSLKPLIRYLERQVNRPIELIVPEDYGTLRRGLRDGSLDIAALPPLEFLLTRQQIPELAALVSYTYEGATTYQGYLVAPTDSPLQDVKGLKGKRFCYVNRESTSGFLLARRFMRSQGIDPDQDLSVSRFSKSHLNVLKDVIDGKCDAGAIYSGALVNGQHLGVPVSKVRVVAATGQLPLDVLVTRPTLDGTVKAKLKKALLAFDPQKELGRPFVSKIYRVSGFIEPRNDSFTAVERAAREEGLLSAE